MASHRMSRLNTDVIGECIEKLHEKRRAVREGGMEGLVAALEGFVPADDIENRYFTVFDRCCAYIRKGGAAEAALAYRAIGLLALTAGDASDVNFYLDIYHRSLPVLYETLQAPSSGVQAMVAALDCLAAVTLGGAPRPLNATSAMRAAMRVIRRAGDDATRPPPEVLTAALSAFAMLLSTIGDGGVDLKSYTCRFKEAMVFQDLVNQLLDSDSPSVVMAAGEWLAVCAEFNLTKLASLEDMDAIEAKVLDLATTDDASGDMTSAEQRQADFFQKIADIVVCQYERPHTEDSTTAPLSSSSGRGVLRVSTWARLVQLSFLKRFLGKGFRKHMQDNPRFRQEEDTSDAADDDDKELTAKKAWRHGGGKGKQWTSAMRKDRDIVWESKNGFSYYD